MRRKTLLLLVMISFVAATQAQKNKKQQPLQGFAVTAAEKGGRSWKEVKMVNISTGEELKSVYQSKQEVEALNARTGKPIVKKDKVATENSLRRVSVSTLAPAAPTMKKVVNLDQELDKAQGRNVQVTRTVYISGPAVTQTDKPFATNSAAMAYDKKHDRLYYTPMGFNQLRYIDLKSGKIYYFEDESFGTVKGMHDAANQITRMAMGSDGNGYALTNDGMHLIRFTTGKNPTITDLGGLTDDAANGTNSFRNRGGFGGDMVADANENLYLITANRNVYKINIETKVATHLGVIKGLPKGFSTNGAMVEEGSKVIVASSESTVGYYRFDLETLQAEKVSESPGVFNASDLANGNLAFDGKKKKKKQQPVVEEITEEPKETVTDVAAKQKPQQDIVRNNSIAVFPNPAVTGESIKLSFADQPTGKYQVQLLDLSGRLIRAQEVNIGSKSQIVNFSLPEVSKGNYLIKVFNDQNKISATSQIVVQ
jgi:Secretion system C-terminal sorting domain